MAKRKRVGKQDKLGIDLQILIKHIQLKSLSLFWKIIKVVAQALR